MWRFPKKKKKNAGALLGIATIAVAAAPALAQRGDGRALSYPMIAGFYPDTNIIQHSRIDLDQLEMELHLAKMPPDFARAEQIYSQGGNSGGRSSITVGALTAKAAKGAMVTQVGNVLAVGRLKTAAPVGSTVLAVNHASQCKIGGSISPDSSGCFNVSGGRIFLDGSDVGAPLSISRSYRTLAGFSAAAEAEMAGQEFYAVYKAYYGLGDYAHRMVMDAIDGTGICSGQDIVARVEVAQKTSAYLNVWMYVIREMEDAIMDCQSDCMDCNDDPVHAWDEAVAFYAGSLEGVDGSGPGVLLHQLADKRCANFETCESESLGGSKVNAQLLELFELGHAKLLQGKCVEVIPVKRRIVELMSVPLVQGALRYAYKVDQLFGGSKEKGEGAVYAAAILPLVAACDVDAARLIGDNMRMDASTHMFSGFKAVKQGFESAYKCLGITCEDIGGLRNYDGAEACVDPVFKEGGPDMGLVMVAITACVLVIGLCVVSAALMMKAKRYKELLDEASAAKLDLLPPETVGGQA